ncbi:MAG: hypothetical protein BGO11_09205 [Solirubrobacterales bacterium 70-9]|nr:MAG: hypothetical protein BGO11_09205 [Solirubrobacterales bacterium 70-9]
MGRLDGRTALITGAARGQGRSHALHFAEEGANLALMDIGHDVDVCAYPLGSEEQLEETARRCRELGAEVWTGLCDVRDAERVEELVGEAAAQLGGLDVLINNAGVSSPTGLSNELSVESWRFVMGSNLDGPFYVGRAAANQMISQGRGGTIVNIGSTASFKAFYSNVAYVAAKHGIVGLTRSMAMDLAPHNIRANCIAPGSVRDDPDLDSRLLTAVAEEWDVPLDTYEGVFADYHLMGVLMEAKDISRACVWLASPDGDRVTGAIIPVDAGAISK